MRINKEGQNDIFIAEIAVLICGVGYPTVSVFFSRCMEALMVRDEEFSGVRHKIQAYSGYIVLVAAVQFTSYFTLFYFMGRAGDKLVRKIRYTIFRHVLRMDIEFFDSDASGSESVTLMLLDEASRLRSIAGQAFAIIQDSAVALFVSIFVVLAADWRLGLVSTGLVPILVISSFLKYKAHKRFQNKAKYAYSSSANLASEMVTSIREVTALGRESEVMEQYNREVDRQSHRHHSWNIMSSILYAFSQGTTPLCVGLQVWYGSKLLIDGTIAIYQFFIAFITLVIAAQAVQTIFSFGPEMALAKDATASISRLLATIPEMDECSTEGIMITDTGEPGTRTYGVSDDVVLGEIEFRKVKFRYSFQPEHSVLQDVSFKIKSGEFTCIVGPEASCDKGAILELIEMFYKPLVGEILMDKNNISQLNLASYRRVVGYINAKATFLEGLSVRENIMLGWVDDLGYDVDENILIKACKIAHIHDFIMSLPEGYNTSGGIVYMASQKIRIALARAILRDPNVLLIDDVLTQYGETITEDQITTVKNAIESAARGRTTIFVTTRMPMVTNADRIILMDKGRIIEQGLRTELMSKKGKLYELVQVQKRLEERYNLGYI